MIRLYHFDNMKSLKCVCVCVCVCFLFIFIFLLLVEVYTLPLTFMPFVVSFYSLALHPQFTLFFNFNTFIITANRSHHLLLELQEFGKSSHRALSRF